MRCVGYRQAWEALDGRATCQRLRERGIAATRQLAKRQLTWLRWMPSAGRGRDAPMPTQVGGAASAAWAVARDG